MFLNNKLTCAVLAMAALCAAFVGSTAHAAEGLFPNVTVMASPPQPTKAPEFDFANLHGGTLKSSALKGRVIIIRFWATW